MDSLFQDIRFGARILLRSPLLTGAILLTLALGIGANTAMFSIVDAVLLHPVPFPNPASLTLVWEQEPRGEVSNASGANFLDWRERSKSFAELAAWTYRSYVITGEDRAQRVGGAAVTANFFRALGAKAALGRTFLPGEDGLPNPAEASRVVVISDRMWRENLGSDPNVLDRILQLNQVPYRIIGVMGPEFQFLMRGHALWVPVTINRSNRDYRFLTVVGRLKKPRTEATAEMGTLAYSLAENYPKSNKGWTIKIDDIREWLVKRNFRVRLLLLAGALAMILLIACTNVASLLLSRSTARARELALRVAVGATPGRIVRQLLIESIILSVSGGILGLILASALVGAAPRILPATAIPTGSPLELSMGVLAFTLGISLATGILFGLAPALSASRTDIQETLKDSSRGSTGGKGSQFFRESIVVLEVAVALMLVSSAALTVESIRKLGSVDPGFRMDNVLTARVFLPSAKYDAAHALDFHRRALLRIAALPGVESAAVGTNLPLVRFTEEVPFDMESAPPREQGERPGVAYVGMSPDYVKVLGIPLKRGRIFTENDNPTAPPVVIVNEAFANRYFPNEDPVGKRILLNRPVLGKEDFEDTIHPEIVGVIGDVKLAELDAKPVPILYAPHAQNVWSTSAWLIIRTGLDPAGLTAAVRREVLELDKDVPVEQANSMEQLYSDQFAEPRFQSQLMGAFAILAMALAMVGIYGVNSDAVAQRGREIALRVALGASAGAILSDVLGRGLKLALAGIVAGLAGAFVAGRLLTSILAGVNAEDPWTLSASAAILLLISALACYFPARKAIRIDPSAALRQG